MPRVRPYESQIGSGGEVPGRTAGLQDFGGAGLANLGQGIENLGTSMGQAQRIINEAKSRKETTDAQIAVTQLGTVLTGKLDEQARNWIPGQPTLSETFLKGHVKPALDALRSVDGETDRFETAAGNSAFQIHAEALTSHMTDLVRTADSRLAGEAAVTQHRQVVDTAGNFLQSHPAYYAIKRDEVASILNDPNGIYGRIPAVERQKLTRQADEQLAISAVQGFIRKSPNLALETLRDPLLKQDERYGWMATAIPNEKMAPLITQAETEVRAFEIDRDRALADENRQRLTMTRTAESSLVEKLAVHMADPSQPMLSARDVLDSNLMALDPEKGKSMLTLIHAWSKEDPNRPVHTNPIIEQGLFKRIHLPDGDARKIVDTDEIYKAYERGQVSFTDMDKLRKEIVESRSPEGSVFGKEKADFLKGMEPRITKPGPFGVYTDPTTPEQFANFKRDLEQTITEYRKDGKNPRVLFDRNSPEYFGKRAAQYEATGFGSMIPTPIPTPMPPPAMPTYGLREDGTPKGKGYFGELKRPDGMISTELSTSDPIDASGKPVLHPLIVPSLSRHELDYLLSGKKGNANIEESIYRKAAEHARARITAGKSPFASEGEQASPPRKSLDEIFGGPDK